MSMHSDLRESTISPQAMGALDFACDMLAWWRWDSATDIIRCSPLCSELLGIPPGAELDRAGFCAAICDEENKALFAALFEDASHSTSIQRIVHRRALANGGVRVLEHQLRAVHGGPEKGPFVGAVVSDVTQQVEQARAFAELAARNTDTAILSGICEYEVDVLGRYTYLSPAFEELTGLSIAVALGRPANDFFTFDKGPSEKSVPEITGAHSGVPFTVEHWVTMPNGRTCWVANTMRALKDASGAVIGFRGVTIDITARKQVEFELAASRQRFVEAADVSGEMVFELDREGRFTYVSELSEDVLGHAAHRLIGRYPFELNLFGTRPWTPEAWLAWLGRKGVRRRVEARIQRADDRVAWVRFNARVRPSPDGSPRGYVGSVRDVTMEKEAEAALIAARVAAEDAARTKAQFLATMSHEIRTPLNAVIGMTALLLDGALSPDERRYAAAANEAGEHLLSLVNDILDFSKLDAGKVELTEEAFDVVDLAHGCRRILENAAEAKGLTLTIDADAAFAARRVGDMGRLRQVLTNLIANAVKFTASGGVVVRLLEGAAGRVRVEVVDTGIGIPAHKIPKLFGDFTQADTSTTRRYGGTGLGLAISKRIVSLMGGEIGVFSQEGVGSTFWIDLPLPLAGDQSRTVARNWRESANRSLNILVAEDNPSNRLLVRALLERLGHNVRLAEDGAAAVLQARLNAPDLVLMDMHMPRMDGGEAATAIRALGPPYEAIPIIAFTADVTPETRIRIEETGMNDFVPKPVRLAELADALDRWGGDARGAQVKDSPCADIPAFDGAVMNEIIELAGIEAMRPVLNVFWSSSAELIAQMRAALAAGDLSGLAKAAHSLKGSAANVGAGRAAAIAKLLEQPDIAEAGALLDALDLALEAARPDLQRLLAA